MINDPIHRHLRNLDYKAHVEVQQLRNLNRKASVAIGLQAVELLQQQRIIEQQRLAVQVQRQMQQLQMNFYYASWIQTEDGRRYKRWHENAVKILAGIRIFDQAWAVAWQAEIDRNISSGERLCENSGHYIAPTILLRVKNAVNPIILGVIAVMAFLAFGVLYSIHSPASFAALGILVVNFALLSWSVLYRDSAWEQENSQRAYAYRTRRIEIFGVDPLRYPPPTWSVNGGHESIRTAYSALISIAATTYPQPEQLPGIMVPQCVNPRHVMLPIHKAMLSSSHFRDVWSTISH